MRYRLLPLSILCLFFSQLPLLTLGQRWYTERSSEAGIAVPGNFHGVAVADYDQDGDEDIYVSQWGGPNLLYRNEGNFRFREVGKKAGIDYEGDTYLSIWGDLDNDGDADLYLGNRDEPNVLYRNEGDGTFTDITRSAGLGNHGKPRSLMLADIDNDGLLDLYVANLGTENVLYRNLGNLRFANITQQAGATDAKISMGGIFLDYDRDGDQDLYLTHDNNQPNILYQNDGTGRFQDVSLSSGTAVASFGMGVDAGDINQDGWPDLYITNLSDNLLLLNQQDGTFRSIAGSSRTTDRGMGWGTVFLDADQDGWLDLYAVNDSKFLPFPNVLYRNTGDLRFEIVAATEPIASAYAGYGVAKADFDQDGMPDLFLVNQGAEGCQIFQGRSHGHHWVQLRLKGVESNRDAIGAKIEVFTPTLVQSRMITAGSGYASQNSRTQMFGLGQATTLDSVVLHWPSGKRETLLNLAVDQLYYVTEGQQQPRQPVSSSPLLIYPHPVRNTCQVQFHLERPDMIEIEWFTLSGQSVGTVYRDFLEQGPHTLSIFAPKEIPGSGWYQLVLSGQSMLKGEKVWISVRP